MTTEFAGAVDLDPPLTASEIAYVRRMGGATDVALMSWVPARDGTYLRPRSGADVDSCLESMRCLIATMERPGRFRGMVAAYDTDTRELAAITVSRGRVTRRLLRATPPASGRRSSSTVIDLASRRRAMARDILA
jgi:hypothetical protein